MEFGVITARNIASEMASRGITVQAMTVIPDDVIGPPAATFIPTASPESPITVLPRTPIVGPEPFIPIYPPPVVTPEDVTEEILPYIPGITEAGEKKGLDKGLLVIIGITAFALMALARQEPDSRKPRRSQYRRTPRQRNSFTRRRY